METDLIFFQPYDRTWPDNPKIVKNFIWGWIPRSMFEVGYQIPPEYSLTLVDLSLEIREGKTLESAVLENLRVTKPKAVLISFPYFVVGGQIERIIKVCRQYSSGIPIILGGGAISSLKKAPLVWWPELTCVYNGFGKNIGRLIKACLSKKAVSIPGVSWRDGVCVDNSAVDERSLIDGYSPEDFYACNGRFDFPKYLDRWQEITELPVGILEMTRGCKFSCSFCAINSVKLGCYSRAPKTVLKEAYFLAERGIKHFYIIDPSFGLLKKKTRELLQEMSSFHSDFPDAEIEIVTRSHLVTQEFATKLKKAGITTVALGMETMDKDVLGEIQKGIDPEETRKAVRIVAEAGGFRIKLLHIIFPKRISEETLKFFAEVDQTVPYFIQSSFLRDPLDEKSEPDFVERDMWVWHPEKDDLQQIKEWMLSSFAFDSSYEGRGDRWLQSTVKKYLAEKRPLEELFSLVKSDDESEFFLRLLRRKSRTGSKVRNYYFVFALIHPNYTYHPVYSRCFRYSSEVE